MAAYKYKTKAGLRWKYQFENRGDIHQQRGFERKQDALEAEAQKRTEVAQGLGVGGRSPLFEDFCTNQFLPRRKSAVAAGKLRSSTYEQDARDIKRLVAAFGKTRLRDIDVERIERFQDEALKRLSPDSVLRVVCTLSVAMKLARRYKLVAFNPCVEVEKPTPRRRTPELPTPAQVEAVADAMPMLDARALVLFAAHTGSRKSECFALRWENVDLTEGDERARIVEQFYKGELVPETKTRAGMREIVLAPRLAAVLRELSVAQQVDSRPNPHGLVFPSPTGERWLDTNWDRRLWAKAREAAGLPGLTFHTLRYFYVSHVRAQGLAASVTEQLTGHVDERTHRAYTRPIPGTEQLIRDALARAFAQEDAA